MYDLIIHNGTVIDPEKGTCQRENVYIRDDVFVEPDHGSDDPKGITLLDATDCFVSPGFIDSHIHAYDGKFSFRGISPDLSNLSCGVTTIVDPGTTGFYNFQNFYNTTIFNNKTTIKALLHVSPAGIVSPIYEENLDINTFNEKKMLRLFQKYPDTLCGIKVRMHEHCAHGLGMEPLKKTVEIAGNIEEAGYPCNVTVHFGELEEGFVIDDILALLRRRDVLVHYLSPTSLDMVYREGSANYQVKISRTQAFDENGRIRQAVWEARKRGIIFDSAFAPFWYSLKNIDRTIAEGFFPDQIGTDNVRQNIYKEPVKSLIHCMSIFLNKGMPLEEVIKAVTYTPAKTYGFLKDAGTLQANHKADVIIFKVVDQEMVHKDVFGDSLTMKRLIMPMATIKEGDIVFRQVIF